MARKLQKLINYHTSGETSMPSGSNVHYGEIVVRHNETKPELLIKVGEDKFATFVDVKAVETQVKNSADAFDLKINGVSASVKSDFATKASLETASGNIETTISSLKTALEGADLAIATELSAVSTTVTELSAGTVADVTRLDGRVDSAFTSAVTVSKEYTNVQLSAVTEDLQGQIDDVDSAITAVKTSVSELSAGTVAEVTRLDTAITTAKGEAISAASAFTLQEIQKVNNVNDGLVKRVETLETSASTLSTELAELSGATEDFSGATYAALTGLSAGTRAEVARLDGRVNSAYDSAVTVAEKYTDKKFTEDFAPIKEKVNTLIGEDSGKTARSIAAEEVAKIVDGADEAFDTLKEIAEWIGDGSGATAAEIVTNIENLKSSDTVISGAVNAVSATVVANKDDIAALGAASAAVKTSVSELSGATEAEVSRLDGRVDSAFTSAVTYVDAQVSSVTKSLQEKEDALDKRIGSLEALSATTQSAIQSATTNSGVKVEKNGTTLDFDFSELVIDCGEF
jgi:chaperonin cofactor prefoldin